jgi:hypothetical protein
MSFTRKRLSWKGGRTIDPNLSVYLPDPHPKQREFIYHPAKRKIVRAGRRGGKTVGIAIYAVEKFLEGYRVLYTTPTSEQVARFWTTITRALREPIEAGVLYKNESNHVIERKGTENRIRAKTAWNADTLRGDYGDILIMDEFQLMNEEVWGVVGAPMLLDNNGDAVFIYTPPSLHSRSVTKANDPQHAAKMFKRFAYLQSQGDIKHAVFHFPSFANPHISRDGLAEIGQDMTALAYRMEIMAEDVDEVPGALWTRETLEKNRVIETPHLERIVVAIDPSATSTGDEAGVMVAGKHKNQGYLLADESLQGSPLTWAKTAVTAYHKYKADRIVAEANQGGEMVELTIRQVDSSVPITLVHASRGKQTRAEPIAAQDEQGRIHLVGSFPKLEDELCLWTPGDASPNRLDAYVWAFTNLMLSEGMGLFDYMQGQNDQLKQKMAERHAATQ